VDNLSNQESIKGAINVAFATNDNKNIDAHFGSAKQFHIYTITENSSSLSDILSIKVKDTDGTINLLTGVDIVYFVDIGAIAVAKIINKGIFPIKYKEIVDIQTEL
jgi:nitrogen fixation protein NifX